MVSIKHYRILYFVGIVVTLSDSSGYIYDSDGIDAKKLKYIFELILGPVLEEKFKSFVGAYPLPMRHGMTIAELARYFNQKMGINCRLKSWGIGK